MTDYETRQEEKIQTMFEILNKSKLNQEKKEEIEDKIFIDTFYSIENFKHFLKKEEAKVKNYSQSKIENPSQAKPERY